jgi:polyisoprenoid-binding protein YceI
MLNKTVYFFFICLSSALGQSWSLDKTTAQVGFSIVHLKVSTVDGSFGIYDASLTSSKKDFTDASIAFTADAASINTKSKSRDAQLRKDEYFDVTKFPKITFNSTSVKKVGTNHKIDGNISIKGVTKPVSLNATFKLSSDGKNVEIAAEGEINRVDFGVGTSGATLNDEVALKISGRFNKQ